MCEFTPEKPEKRDDLHETTPRDPTGKPRPPSQEELAQASDSQLGGYIAYGDKTTARRAFQVFHARHVGEMWRYARSLLGADAADVDVGDVVISAIYNVWVAIREGVGDEKL